MYSALKRSLMPSILHTLRQWHSIQSTRKTQLLNETQSGSERTIIVGTNISVITVSEFSCMHIAIMWPWSSWMHKNLWLTTMRSMLMVQLRYYGCGWQVWPCRDPQCDAALQRGVNCDSWSAIDSVDCLHSVPPASGTAGAGISTSVQSTPKDTVEPPIMDPPTRGQPLIRDTLHGTICILLVLVNLPPKDSLSIKDEVSAPKVPFIRRLYCSCKSYAICSFSFDT